MKIHLSSSNCYVFVVILSWIAISSSIDTLKLSESITSNQTLISALNHFQLGFFSPGNSNKFYLAIWFNVIPTQIVWIANRGTPLNDTSGVLRIGNDGNLILLDKTDRIIWSTDIIVDSSSGNIVAQLLDSGNLVLRDYSKEEASFLWQSFDHPSHAVVPGMKFRWDFRTGLNLNLTSWKSSDDPSPGEYTHGFDLQGLPQLITWKDSSKQFRSGPWNGIDFGLLDYQPNDRYFVEATIDSEEVYYVLRLHNNSSLMMSAISYSGALQLLIRDSSSNDWRQLFVAPWDNCGIYAYCGPNSVCTPSETRVCSCMIGYTPRDLQDWDDRIWAGGCIQENSFNCSESGLFKEFEGLKMPDFFDFRVNTSMSLEECEAECLKNCSCTAYANSNATGAGHGCLLWFGDLIDVSVLPTPRSISQRLYIRVTSADLVAKADLKDKRKIVVIVVTTAASILLLLVVLFFIWKRKSWKEGTRQRRIENENLEIPSFDIVTIARATQDFSLMNKIGEGGFGPVYKGKLSTGQEIAVKRLSEGSHQGPIEFKNEVMLIAKLQHRNLVKLLGYCIHGEERMLIYEYMSNGSLDSYIFGGSSSANGQLFEWKRRFAIIEGIARGLLYLQRDSRLIIIHRDLKASNVLLDSDMNPKISDFGLARTFGEEQLTVKTKRVVGTYGYMAPEYAIDGIYSMKSDVFSFGVIVLEMVSGKRNTQFHHPDHDFNLLGHTWKIWIDGRGSDLIDPMMEDSFPMHEVLRCIHVGLLCVQQRPEDRPTMSSVLSMFDSESAMPPQPKHPAYYTERVVEDSNPPSDEKNWTVNNLTNTVIKGR